MFLISCKIILTFALQAKLQIEFKNIY